MSGALCAAANMTAAPIPPLLAGILFDGSTADVHYNVANDEGDIFTDFGAQFDLSSSGGAGSVALYYDVTANSGHGYCSNVAHTIFGQGGTTISTSQIMTMAWGINFTALSSIGDTASVTVRCKAVDSLGTTTYSSPITVSVTRTS